MMLKVFYTEEPTELCGVDIPCCVGDYMDPWDNDESNLDIDENTFEGYHWYPIERVMLLKKGRPICDIDDLVRDILTRRIDRYDAARKVDWHLDRLIHIRLAVDLIMGEFLIYMKKQGVSPLGYRSIGTFSVEHLSFSGRLTSEMMHNCEVLQALPLTKEAYLHGEIMKTALRYASRIMTPQNEAEWLSMAQSLSLNDLEKEVKQALQEMASAEEDAGTDENNGSSEDCESSENCENSEGRKNSSGTHDITRYEPDFPSEESAGTDSFLSSKKSQSPYSIECKAYFRKIKKTCSDEP